jgi:hypothetical protein
LAGERCKQPAKIGRLFGRRVPWKSFTPDVRAVGVRMDQARALIDKVLENPAQSPAEAG